MTPLLISLLRLRPYEIELLRPKEQAPPLAWGLLVAGLLASSVAVLVGGPAWREHAALARQRSELAAMLAPGRAESTADHRGGRGKSGADNSSEAGALLADLHRPWHELFDQLESAVAQPPDEVHLVQLSVEARFQGMQLVAEGRDLDKLVRFAQRLGGQAPIRAVTLSHHEWRDVLGGHVVSATLRGELAGAGGAGSSAP